ncbi:hypothetical protein C8F04DRAFT_1179546 [Mycena alexandri]|uniref:Uncharacterized protein n=1 Tax=Mycena alexandri TaxID=1745969 RepID=A0AAD6X6K6_9AGAR|nr:hypothetical protein C8F04DRAFT_1179546 [Mycena alexandri]
MDVRRKSEVRQRRRKGKKLTANPSSVNCKTPEPEMCLALVALSTRASQEVGEASLTILSASTSTTFITLSDAQYHDEHGHALENDEDAGSVAIPAICGTHPRPWRGHQPDPPNAARGTLLRPHPLALALYSLDALFPFCFRFRFHVVFGISSLSRSPSCARSAWVKVKKPEAVQTVYKTSAKSLRRRRASATTRVESQRDPPRVLRQLGPSSQQSTERPEGVMVVSVTLQSAAQQD